MDDHNIVDKYQHGSTKGRITVSQLIQQQEEILDMIISGDNAGLIYLDFSKTNDKIHIEIMLKKLESIGIVEENLMWIEISCVIENRVSNNNSLSKW